MSTHIVGKARRNSKQPRAFRLKLGEKAYDYTHSTLASPDDWDSLRTTLTESKSLPKLYVRDLFSWADESRYHLLNVLHSASRPFQIRAHLTCELNSSALVAILDAAGTCDSIDRQERLRRAAIEAASLFHPDAVDIVSARIAQRLRGAGIDGVTKPGIRSSIQQLVGTPQTLCAGPTVAAQQFVAQLDHKRNAQSSEEQQALHTLLHFHEDFYEFNGKCWDVVRDADLSARVVTFLQQPRGAEVTAKLANDVMVNLKAIVHLSLGKLTPPLWLESPGEVVEARHLTLANGFLDLDEVLCGDENDLQLYEHDRRNFTTVALPYEHDPDAKCPLWLRTLGEVLPRTNKTDRRIKLLQEYMGWSLVASDKRFERFLAMVGDGANGKSTVLRVWEALLGTENVSHLAIEQLTTRFDAAAMAGKLANIAAEMNFGGDVGEGRLKAMVTGDPIQIDRKYKPPISMWPTAKLIFATNALPQFKDRSEGLWRRLIAMPFLVSIPRKDQDKSRSERLMEELPGILNWALVGLRRLYSQGEFTDCEECRRCGKEHRTHSDPFLQFVEQHVEFDPNQYVYSQAAYDFYVKFCGDNCRMATNSSDFGKRLRKLGGVKKERDGAQPRYFFHFSIGIPDCEFSFRESAIRRKSTSTSNRRPR